jgi:hypothetical protein
MIPIVSNSAGSISTAPASSHRPSARVGASLISTGDNLFLWGGREGKAMQPCDGTLWRYSLRGQKWASVTPDGDIPEDRSYHCMALLGEEIYRAYYYMAIDEVHMCLPTP